MLLATDGTGRAVWHVAVDRSNLEALLKVWEWAKGTLTKEEINYKLLLDTDDKRRTVWYVAVEGAIYRHYRKCGSGVKRT